MGDHGEKGDEPVPPDPVSWDQRGDQMRRLKLNMNVSTQTIERLCRALECQVEDVMEVVLEDPGTEE